MHFRYPPIAIFLRLIQRNRSCQNYLAANKILLPSECIFNEQARLVERVSSAAAMRLCQVVSWRKMQWWSEQVRSRKRCTHRRPGHHKEWEDPFHEAATSFLGPRAHWVRPGGWRTEIYPLAKRACLGKPQRKRTMAELWEVFQKRARAQDPAREPEQALTQRREEV